MVFDSDFTLNEMCEMEKKGKVFVKWAKSKNYQSEFGNSGVNYAYYNKVGKVLPDTNTETGYTVVLLEHILNYIGDYGVELVVFDFHKLKEIISDPSGFNIQESSDWLKKGVYYANTIYVKEVIPYNSEKAEKLIFDALKSEDLSDDERANYLGKYHFYYK